MSHLPVGYATFIKSSLSNLLLISTLEIPWMGRVLANCMVSTYSIRNTSFGSIDYVLVLCGIRWLLKSVC